MAKKNEAKIKFTAETGEFNEQINEAEGSLKELRSELKLNSSQMKKTGDNTETLKKRQGILAKELEASKDKTDALSKKLEKAKEIFGENSDEAKRLQIQLNNAKAAEQKIADEIADTNKKLKEQKTAFDDVADKAEKAGEKLTNAGKKMSVVSAGIAAVGGASIAAFNEVDEGADNVIKATGATGEAAEELEAVYGKVAGSIVGDFADIGAAVGEINTRFGYTGDKLEKASLDFEKFASITGVDAKDAVQSVSRALNDAGIPLDEYDTLLDQLAKAGQAAGIDVNTLADSLATNGAVMRSMGFDTEETLALLSQFELSGADATTMLSGMKRAMANWAKEGKNGNKEFAKTVEGIKNGSIDASDALEIFGTRAGPMLVDAIKTGKFEYKDMLKTIQNSKGTVESTFDATVDGGYKMELAMQNAKVALGEVGDTLSTSLTPIVEDATEKLQGFASWWGELDEQMQTNIITIGGVVAVIGPLLIVLGSVAGAISKITKAMKMTKPAITAVKKVMGKLNLTFLSSPIFWIIAAIVALIAIFVVLWRKCDWFRAFWINLWEKVKSGCANAWKAVTGFFTEAWATVKNIWGSVKQWFANIWNGIKNTFANVGGWFRDKFNSAKQGVQNAWSSVTGFFSNIYTKIKNKFAQVKNAIVQPFKTAIDKVKGFFNNLKLKFPKIKMPHFKITGEFSLNPPSVPKLGVEWYAKGGIFTKPTIFPTASGLKGVGDVRGGEAVLPIDRLRGYVADAVQMSAPQQDLRPLVDAIEELASRPIEFGINGRRFARVTARDTDSENGLRNALTDRGLVLD